MSNHIEHHIEHRTTGNHPNRGHWESVWRMGEPTDGAIRDAHELAKRNTDVQIERRAVAIRTLKPLQIIPVDQHPAAH